MLRPQSGKIGIFDKKELADARWFAKKDLPSKIAFDSNQKVLKNSIALSHVCPKYNLKNLNKLMLDQMINKIDKINS